MLWIELCSQNLCSISAPSTWGCGSRVFAEVRRGHWGGQASGTPSVLVGRGDQHTDRHGGMTLGEEQAGLK